MVTADWRISFSTVLGSCVAVCLLDPLVGVAGMNHFMLPEAPNACGWLDARMEFLEREGIGVYDGCVGGAVARRIEFIPGNASVTVRKYPEHAANASRPEVPVHVRGYAA